MKRLGCLLLAVTMLVSTTVSAGHVTPIERPAALVARAWAAPFVERPDDDWSARLDGECRNKVAWVIEQMGCGQMVIGWRNIDGHGRARHAALLVDGWVYDCDGAWPLEAYGRLMTIEEIVG
jgi:hypothetical protein